MNQTYKNNKNVNCSNAMCLGVLPDLSFNKLSMNFLQLYLKGNVHKMQMCLKDRHFHRNNFIAKILKFG